MRSHTHGLEYEEIEPLIPVNWENRKKNDVDVCNICLNVRQLSEDHVPPKGATEVHNIEVKMLFNNSRQYDNERSRFAQDGIKFKTICRECNSLLGEYDRELINFVNSYKQFAKSSIILPERLTVPIKPNTIIRSFAGHMLSSVLTPDEARFGNEVRSIIFNREAPIPERWHVYYWHHPYLETIIMKDISIMDPFNEHIELGMCQILKFYPFAFLICDNSSYGHLNYLSKFKNRPADFTANFSPIPFSTCPVHWPERFFGSPFTMNAMTVDQPGTRAVPKIKKKKLRNIKNRP